MYKKMWYVLIIFIIIAVNLVGCLNKKDGINSTESNQKSDDKQIQGTVLFDIKEINDTTITEENERLWLGTYKKNGKVARFRIKLNIKEPENGLPLSFSKGAFYSEKDSESQFFLNDIATALEATEKYESKKELDSLAVDIAILGVNQIRGDNGSFSSASKGDWITTKIFVEDGQGEFFLNINPVMGLGEISIKDPEYGDIVLNVLSRIL